MAALPSVQRNEISLHTPSTTFASDASAESVPPLLPGFDVFRAIRVTQLRAAAVTRNELLEGKAIDSGTCTLACAQHCSSSSLRSLRLTIPHVSRPWRWSRMNARGNVARFNNVVKPMTALYMPRQTRRQDRVDRYRRSAAAGERQRHVALTTHQGAERVMTGSARSGADPPGNGYRETEGGLKCLHGRAQPHLIRPTWQRALGRLRVGAASNERRSNNLALDKRAGAATVTPACRCRDT
jgi:hypothetical protein